MTDFHFTVKHSVGNMEQAADKRVTHSEMDFAVGFIDVGNPTISINNVNFVNHCRSNNISSYFYMYSGC